MMAGLVLAAIGAMDTVFVHSWAFNGQTAPDTLQIAQEMLKGLNLSWPVSVTTVNAATWPNETQRVYAKQGFEDITLDRIHRFCNRHQSATVVYLHTKGAYHPSEFQTEWRRNMVAAAKTCVARMKEWDYDVCGYIIQRKPIPHLSGNIWTAKCAYIKLLVSPAVWKRKFLDRYYRLDMMFSNISPWCQSAKRFSDETWVTAHPAALIVATHGVQKPLQGCPAVAFRRAKALAKSIYRGSALIG